MLSGDAIARFGAAVSAVGNFALPELVKGFSGSVARRS
jgi:hypothetical protein